MPKALTFKGDPKPKKRKRPAPSNDARAPSPSEATPEDESWVLPSSASDISGPVLLVLRAAADDDDDDVLALSSDANGTPFLLAVENLVDGRPETAEPHDVRQVWIASRVAGGAHFGLKGKAGYLSSARGLSAGADAQGAREGWTLLSAEGKGEGWFRLRSEGASWLCLADGKAGTTADEDAAVAVCVRMQARFKPRLAAEKRERAEQKVGRAQIEREAGRTLDDDEVRRLKRARKRGTYYEEMLDVRQKGKHDKYA